MTYTWRRWSLPTSPQGARWTPETGWTNEPDCPDYRADGSCIHSDHMMEAGK